MIQKFKGFLALVFEVVNLEEVDAFGQIGRRYKVVALLGNLSL